MKKVISFFLCLIVLSLSIGSNAQRYVEPIRALVDGGNSDRVHLRAKPSTDAKSLGLYFTGTVVFCDAFPTEEWTKVSLGSQDGYMKSEYLRWGNDMYSVLSKQPIGVVHTGGWVNVRSIPSKTGEVIGKLYGGDTLTILGETATHWYYVTTANTVGYVLAEYVAIDETGGVQNGSVPVVPQDAHVEAQYRLVLENQLEFYNTTSNLNMYLEQLNRGFNGMSMQLKQFAVVDLDADGTVEVVVKIAVNNSDYGYEILDYYNGVVYGYDIVYRAFMDLKVDGTFSYAGGAADTGYGTLTFHQNRYTVHTIANSEAAGSSRTNYYHNGITITDTKYMQLIDEQARKQNVDWLDFTSANIAMRFSK